MNSEPTKVVAFLQNMWMRNPERGRRYLEEGGDKWWRRATVIFLFSGCLTGRRIKKAFGQETCDRIIWEESTQEIAGDPKIIFPPDLAHIRRVLESEKPNVVLTFGKIAGNAVSPLWSGKLIQCPHPAARQADVPARLNAAAEELKKLIWDAR